MIDVFFRITGGELFERVINDDFVLTEKASVMFMRQICDGVSFMHSRHILHLDMKVSEYRYNLYIIKSTYWKKSVILFDVIDSGKKWKLYNYILNKTG